MARPNLRRRRFVGGLITTERAPTEAKNLDRYGDAAGWPAQVEGDAFTAPFNAPSAGPPPWHVYRFTFHQVVGVATKEPFGATKWRFQS